jgi:acyl-CoA thioesterase YciA
MTTHRHGLPQGRVPVLRVPATPAHTNAGGDIFGGWIMGQVDIAGAIPAVLRAKGRVVTVAVQSLTFLEPVYVGDILSLYAEIVCVGRSSMSTDIQVYAQRNPASPRCVRVCEARLVYVAVDDNGRPRPVPEEG